MRGENLCLFPTMIKRPLMFAQCQSLRRIYSHRMALKWAGSASVAEKDGLTALRTQEYSRITATTVSIIALFLYFLWTNFINYLAKCQLVFILSPSAIEVYSEPLAPRLDNETDITAYFTLFEQLSWQLFLAVFHLDTVCSFRRLEFISCLRWDLACLT